MPSINRSTNPRKRIRIERYSNSFNPPQRSIDAVKRSHQRLAKAQLPSRETSYTPTKAI